MKYTLYIICMLFALSASARRSKTECPPPATDMRFISFYMEAQRQLRHNNLAAAYELFNYCKQLNPQSPEVLYFMAPLNIILNQDSIALADMERAVEMAPDNYWYSELLSKLYFNRNRPTDAISVLEQMKQRWSDKQELNYMMLDAYASQNMVDSVLSVLERIEVKDGKSDQISLEKVKIYTQRNDVKSIIDEMEDLVKASPTTTLPVDLLPRLLKEKSDAFILLGDIYHKAGNEERAFQYYDSCLVYKPDDAMALNNYAYYLALSETKLDTAEVMSRRSNQLDPDNPTYLDTLAWILYLRGNYVEAKRLIDRTVELMKPEELEEAEDVREHLKKINDKLK